MDQLQAENLLLRGLLAEQLGYMHLNSGLLFRALAYLLIKRAEKYEATPEKPYLDDQQKIATF